MLSISWTILLLLLVAAFIIGLLVGRLSSTTLPQQMNLDQILREINRATQLGHTGQRLELYEKALGMVSREAQPELWALLQSDLASSLIAAADLDPDNWRRAIYHYENALQVFHRQEYPDQWARIQVSLGIVYANSHLGDRRSNLERAIQYFENALQIFTRENHPKVWNDIQTFMEQAYGALVGNPTTDAPPPPKPKKGK